MERASHQSTGVCSRSSFSRARLACLLFLIVPLGLQANPVVINPESWIAFWIVVFWALVIESSIETLALVFCGIIYWPAFFTLVIANFGAFAFGFMPLTERVPLWLLEPMVVVFDAVVIKLVASVPAFQGGNYVGINWRRALGASLVGNAASYFIGILGSHRPWVEHLGSD